MSEQVLEQEATFSRADEPTSIRFPEGLPGFEAEHAWELLAREDVRPFLWLRSCRNPALALLVVDPRLLLPDYVARVPDQVAVRVGARGLEGLVLLAVVTLQQDGGATVNLRAPIVVNPETMVGIQVILDRRDLPLRYQLTVEEDGEE